MLVGRGRGHVSTDRREQLRRPVDLTYFGPLEDIATKIAALQNDSPDELDIIKDDISKHCTSAVKLKLLVSDLHERSLVNREFGAKCAMALATQSKLTVGEKQLRTLLMKNIQTEFEDKKNLRHHNMNRFLNTFAFIGEVFRHIRLANGAPISILASALIEYCELLITGTEPEVELCVQQLAYNGKLLKQWNAQQLTALQVLIRSACMVPGSDPRSLCWLHLACDLDRFTYGSLSTELFELYKVKLGAQKMKVVHKLLGTPDLIVVEEEVDEVLALNGIHIDGRPEKTSPVPPPEILKHTFNNRDLKKSTGHVGGSDFGPPEKPKFSPREPRTSRNPAGDSVRNQDRPNYSRDRRSDPRNDPANWLPRHEPMSDKDKEIWGNERRRGNSYGHDDRFDKEDDFYGSRGRRNAPAGRGRSKANQPPPPPVPSTSTEESWD